ncbi:hypothetical protein RCL1_001440 [Eukaryota sp. TZLM3-RCL]
MPPMPYLRPINKLQPVKKTSKKAPQAEDIPLPKTVSIFANVSDLENRDPSIHYFCDTDLADNVTVDIWDRFRYACILDFSARHMVSSKVPILEQVIDALKHPTYPPRNDTCHLIEGTHSQSELNIENFVLGLDDIRSDTPINSSSTNYEAKPMES